MRITKKKRKIPDFFLNYSRPLCHTRGGGGGGGGGLELANQSLGDASLARLSNELVFRCLGLQVGMGSVTNARFSTRR